MVHRSTAVIALALALVVPASASAAPREVTRFVPSYAEPFGEFFQNSWATPVLAGDSAVWARSRPSSGWVVERGTPDARPSRVAFSERPTGGYRVLHRITMAGGSPTRVAWSDGAVEVHSASHMAYTPFRHRLMTATPGGAPAPVLECTRFTECYEDGLVGYDSYFGDLDGEVVAYITGRYPDYSIVVDDLQSSAEPVRIETGSLDYRYLRIAGSYVVWTNISIDGYETVVYDWRARREVYRAPGSGYELQSDGKVAAVAPGDDGGIRWYSRSEPRAHEIDPPSGGFYGAVRIAGDRLLALERDGRARTLVVMGLDGSGRRSIGPVQEYPAGYDFDGKRATWATAECGFVSMWFDPDVDVEAPVRAGAALPPCTPPSIRGIQAAGDGRIVVKLVCAASCRGRLDVFVDPELGTARPLARRRIGLRANRRVRRVYLKPSKADRARIRKRPRVLNIQAIFEGSDGDRSVAATRRGSLKRP